MKTQDLSPEELAALPVWCTWEGTNPAYAHLLGHAIPTTRVQEIVPVGERENIWVLLPDGERERPWLNVVILEVDTEGNVVPETYHREKLPKHGPRAMSTADIGALGITDFMLDEMARERLGEGWEPDRPGPSDARREMFDRVMAKS